MPFQEQLARDDEQRLCQKLIDEELKQRDESHQALLKSKVGLYQQQLAMAKETINREREKVERLQGQAEASSPVCVGRWLHSCCPTG
eukprot:2650819-Prorocentrum_lima.AAC.1